MTGLLVGVAVLVAVDVQDGPEVRVGQRDPGVVGAEVLLADRDLMRSGRHADNPSASQ